MGQPDGSCGGGGRPRCRGRIPAMVLRGESDVVRRRSCRANRAARAVPLHLPYDGAPVSGPPLTPALNRASRERPARSRGSPLLRCSVPGLRRVAGSL